jgi:hypothetical protein
LGLLSTGVKFDVGCCKVSVFGCGKEEKREVVDLKVGLLSSSLKLAILRLLFWGITWGFEVGSCLGCGREEKREEEDLGCGREEKREGFPGGEAGVWCRCWGWGWSFSSSSEEA